MAKVEIEDAELAALRRQLAKAEAENERFKDYDAKAAELVTTKGKLAELNATREKAAFEALGVQSEKARRFLAMEFEGMPAEGKPADVTAWLESMKAAPDKIPADLAPFIQIPAAGTQAGAGQGQRPAVNVPNANTGAAAPPVVPGTFTPEQVEKMSFEEMQANLPALLAQEPGLRAVVTMFTPPSNTQPKA